jgi:hypothetical protein
MVPAIMAVLANRTLLGFGAGHFTFRLKQRRCQDCNRTLGCPLCVGAGACWLQIQMYQ